MYGGIFGGASYGSTGDGIVEFPAPLVAMAFDGADGGYEYGYVL